MAARFNPFVRKSPIKIIGEAEIHLAYSGTTGYTTGNAVLTGAAHRKGNPNMETAERSETNSDAADHVAVSELVADIEGELHLHIARVQEFMDGTREFAPVTSDVERERLEKLRRTLSEAVCGVGDA